MGKSYDDVAQFLSIVHKDTGFKAEPGAYLNLLGLCEIADALNRLAEAIKSQLPPVVNVHPHCQPISGSITSPKHYTTQN